MGQFSSDEELHQAVNAFAFENAVNYSEALKAVDEIERAKEYRNSDTVRRGIVPPQDADFHAAAVAYQHKHKVPYSEAAKAVESHNQAKVADYMEAVSRKRPPYDDYQLHLAAKEYQHAKNVDYMEAITAVTNARHGGPEQPQQPQNFSEAPAPLDAKKALEGQEIEIFKAGNHVASDGRAREFSAAVVAAMAAVYSPARHEAPLTLGHPSDNLPAYGWVKSLRATDDGRLMMRAGDVTPEFSEAVKAGRYKKRSASFYPPGAPNNPAPGNWYLRHVAWLGAQVPAVRGLADVNFEAQGSAEYPCFDF